MRLLDCRLLLVLVPIALLHAPQSAVSLLPDQIRPAGEELIDLWRDVDAVVFVKISQNLGERKVSDTGCTGFHAHEARVLEAFRLHFGGPKETAVLLQPTAPCSGVAVGDAAAQYRPGDEYIGFLRWNVTARAFTAYVMAPVRNGEVKSPYIQDIAKGMSIAAFLVKLRAMME